MDLEKGLMDLLRRLILDKNLRTPFKMMMRPPKEKPYQSKQRQPCPLDPQPV
jgi:hypothetical protein